MDTFARNVEGLERLAKSLTRPVTRADVIRRMDRLLLRFSFMSGLIGNEEMVAFLSALIEETQGYLEVLEAEFRASAPGIPFTGKSALEQGVESYRTTVRWARMTLGALRKLHSVKGERR